MKTEKYEVTGDFDTIAGKAVVRKMVELTENEARYPLAIGRIAVPRKGAKSQSAPKASSKPDSKAETDDGD